MIKINYLTFGEIKQMVKTALIQRPKTVAKPARQFGHAMQI